MYQLAGDDCAKATRHARVPRLQTIDRNQLEAIRASLGPARLSRLLELAQSELTERPRVIRQWAVCEDFAQLRNEAHGFKGAVASLGLVGVALAATAVELAAPGVELELALIRLDGESNHARIALGRVTCGQPIDDGLIGWRPSETASGTGVAARYNSPKRAKPGHDQNESDD